MRTPALPFLLVIAGFSLLNAAALRADQTVSFPKDNPAFTCEVADGLHTEFTAEGTLVVTGQADNLNVKGVFMALPNMHSDRDVRMGLYQLVRLAGRKSITSNLSYPAPFDQNTTSGVPTITYSAFGKQNGQDFAVAFIVFSKAGKYYELIVSGSTTAMTKLNFPHSFRETMKLTP